MRDLTKSPWAVSGVVVDAAILARVDEEARAAYARDEESCGLIRANKLHALDPETYPRTGRMYFDIDPMKFARAVREGEANGRPVKVLYHSHLDVGAYFSDTDASAATAGGEAPTYDLAYLVTSVRQGVVDDRKLFVWDTSRRAFVEAPLVVAG